MNAVCEEFDRKFKVIESALKQLFNTFPQNSDPAHVLLKAIAINSLYSTQIPIYTAQTPTVLEVVDHIVARNIDAELEAGSAKLVYDIARIESTTKKTHFYYSFATKYCSWHKPSLYPIYDSRVDEYLWRFMRYGHLSAFDRQELKIYSKFKEKVINFRDYCGLGDVDFKEIDKFLYIEGGKLLENPRALASSKEHEIPDVPWNEDIYASEQEREQAKARFTDNDGWHVVSPPLEKAEEQ